VTDDSNDEGDASETASKVVSCSQTPKMVELTKIELE
jgi:hypothetical protein